jgi:hypothetical protein
VIKTVEEDSLTKEIEMSGTTVGQALLAMIESDLATVGGQPLLGLLTALQAAKGNVLLQQAAILQFVASAPTAGITLEIEVEGQLLGLLITKVQAFVAAKSAPAPAAA